MDFEKVLDTIGQSIPIRAMPFYGITPVDVNAPNRDPLASNMTADGEEKNSTESYVDIVRTMKYLKQAAGRMIAEESDLRDTTRALDSLGLPAVSTGNLTHAYPRIMVPETKCNIFRKKRLVNCETLQTGLQFLEKTA